MGICHVWVGNLTFGNYYGEIRLFRTVKPAEYRHFAGQTSAFVQGTAATGQRMPAQIGESYAQ